MSPGVEVTASGDVTPTVALLPSPLLGPASWQPVAERLSAAGWPVTTVALAEDRATPGRVLAGMLAALPADRPLVLVPHSGAGLYVAALAAERQVSAIVLVDAGMPSLEGPTRTAPAGMLSPLEELSDADGMLPPWTRWWPPEDVDELFPDDRTRRLVEPEQARLPLSYFRASVPAPVGWERLPCAYLAFGDTYAEELARARAQGWPVVQRAGRHLHQLADPQAVTVDLQHLLQRLGTPAPPRSAAQPRSSD